jgi:hypothetical protein
LGSDQRGSDWLLRTTGEESTAKNRWRRWLSGQHSEVGEATSGWPFSAGTAGMVMPTAAALVALRRTGKRPGAQSRIDQGREFLLARVCRDGGWDYGPQRTLGVESDSSPDTTGAALVALAGLQSPVIDRALTRAAQFLPGCRSARAQAWLRMGLAAHGRKHDAPPVPVRDTAAAALLELAEASEQGRFTW